MKYLAFMYYIDIEKKIHLASDEDPFAAIWAEELCMLRLPAGVPRCLIYQPLVF
jgi:hypothetical protein